MGAEGAPAAAAQGAAAAAAAAAGGEEAGDGEGDGVQQDHDLYANHDDDDPEGLEAVQQAAQLFGEAPIQGYMGAALGHGVDHAEVANLID
ncbi:unnamed protein product [Vitrella brassicaformis CCMP3155]|uniref:Uncharacterized protein n=1 Tax=Vitrella brassicaformis (strain CCMP3155) TaxID=1169540 RepID=A0A0G4GPY5_VITBC|nr:unnamed protein product [Vitrella brassicaformis CCMP3155]|eukprot:CEM32436.1 unnamed protein product [Vitrella brassicaformis CCMP3155]